jgi:hypothetical protein
MNNLAPMNGTRHSFDSLLARLGESSTTLTERDLLLSTHWDLGEDARLREDFRFRQTKWGRWMRSEDFLANDFVYRSLQTAKRSSVPVGGALSEAAQILGRRCVFCADDPRFVLRSEEIQLATSELSEKPVIEDEVGDLEKYTTHLPIHSLRAAAASEPAGEWGESAQDEIIETLGWVRVDLNGRNPNDRMFIAEIEGHSMDDGKSGLVDGGYAVFELWPSGSKQLLNVLVRGAFRDPETGSFAVKKYVADARDSEGRHQKIALVSLNPNKERYPDIELAAEDDEALTVVAKVVQSLSTDNYERQPKVRQRFGQRRLEGMDGVNEQGKRLGQRVERFFDSLAPVDEEIDDSADVHAQGGWVSRVVCLDPFTGGPQLEIGPLQGLPLFVKKLRATGTSHWDGFVLAANARNRSARVPLIPGTGPWKWEAVGFEVEHDLGFDRLSLEDLPIDVVTLFRVDAQGVGHRSTSKTVSPGQSYRVLLPPSIGDASGGYELGNGWRLWSLDFGSTVSGSIVQALASIGLAVGEDWPRLEWTLFPATAWGANASGASYPIFESGTEVFVNISGLSIDAWEAAMLFAHGPTGTEQLALKGNGVVSLGKLAEGRWACALLHQRTAVKSTTLIFEVAKISPQRINATCSVTAAHGLPSLEVTAPPGWPVTFSWNVLTEDIFARAHACEDGTVDLAEINARIEARARRSKVADLIVDFGELGRHRVPHNRVSSVDQVSDELAVMWRQRSALLEARSGDWLSLLPLWFEPVVTLLGYHLEPRTTDKLLMDQEAPYGLASWMLTIDERSGKDVTRSPVSILVLTTDIDAALTLSRDLIDHACANAHVRVALVTDGVRWTTHQRGSSLARERWHIGDAINSGTIGSMLAYVTVGL